MTDLDRLTEKRRVLEALQTEAYQTSKASGFHDNDQDYEVTLTGPLRDEIARRLLLVMTEIGEAAEELRDATDSSELVYPRLRADGKLEGFGSELADVVIRVFDTAETYGIDLGVVLLGKMAYNKTRSSMHGRKI